MYTCLFLSLSGLIGKHVCKFTGKKVSRTLCVNFSSHSTRPFPHRSRDLCMRIPNLCRELRSARKSNDCPSKNQVSRSPGALIACIPSCPRKNSIPLLFNSILPFALVMPVDNVSHYLGNLPSGVKSFSPNMLDLVGTQVISLPSVRIRRWLGLSMSALFWVSTPR